MKEYLVFIIVIIPWTLLSLALCGIFIKAMRELFKNK